MLMPIDVQGGLYKAEEDGVSLPAISSSDGAEVNISLENGMQAVLVLSTQGVQNPWAFTAANALSFSSPSSLLRSLSVCSVCISVSCSFSLWDTPET